MGSPKVKVRLEDSLKIMVLLDTNTEIHMMIKEVLEDAGLAMKLRPKLELVLHMGYS